MPWNASATLLTSLTTDLKGTNVSSFEWGVAKNHGEEEQKRNKRCDARGKWREFHEGIRWAMVKYIRGH